MEKSCEVKQKKKVLESRAKPLQHNRVDNKVVFFICAIGISGGSSLYPILYCWKIESQTSSEEHNQTSALPLFFELAL